MKPGDKKGGKNTSVVASREKILEAVRLPIVLNGHIRIPGWVVDLDSFRRWARSEAFPEHGWLSFLDGELWVDLSREQIFSHNQVRGELTLAVGGLIRAADLGYWFTSRAVVSNVAANLSTQPDALFVSWDALRTRRIRLVAGSDGDYVELEGSPEVIIEVVSSTSVSRDSKVLRDLYWRAGVPEYWLIDARGESPRFEILRHTPERYVSTRRRRGWLKSAVFGHAFQWSQHVDRFGYPEYTLAVQP
jgi:Uma2 family endonuclease